MAVPIVCTPSNFRIWGGGHIFLFADRMWDLKSLLPYRHLVLNSIQVDVNQVMEKFSVCMIILLCYSIAVIVLLCYNIVIVLVIVIVMVL